MEPCVTWPKTKKQTVDTGSNFICKDLPAARTQGQDVEPQPLCPKLNARKLHRPVEYQQPAAIVAIGRAVSCVDRSAY